MIYQVQKIIRDVRIALDENETSIALTGLGDIETLSLDKTITSKIEEAARQVETVAPVHYLEEGHTFGESICWCNDGSGYILVPDDFMRLVAFRMSDWERTVYQTVSVTSAEYRCQTSRYKGIRGNPQKPVCALVSHPEGKALEFYSSHNDKAYVHTGLYLPYPVIDRNDGIDICERCYIAVIYTIAALVLTIYKEEAKAASMTELAQQNLQQ